MKYNYSYQFCIMVYYTNGGWTKLFGTTHETCESGYQRAIIERKPAYRVVARLK